MPVDRPTFSENWYRVADLKPRLRDTVQSFRQNYRGRMYYVLRDPSNQNFFRVSSAGYHFIGLLDGKKTIREAWELANEHLGDSAPTQGEAIQLLGQVYVSNLLQGELPADAAGMFERYRKRINREVRGYLMNILFLRIPIFDPNNILNAWVKLFGLAFSYIGMIAWLLILAAGGYALIQNWEQFIAGVDPQSMLAVDNLVALYIGFALIKAIHEFGHGFACKRFGKLNGSGGDVHTIGIMFLVFMPVPYVDASSSWAFRSKWQRAMVGAAGMYVELAVASIAAIVWAQTNNGLVHDIAYNMVFVASVSTILFNGNPLLRYDGYFILCDLLELPNLNQRSKDYLYYLIKKFVYGVKRPRDPSHTVSERWMLVVYSIAAAVYRIFVFAAIFWYVSQQFFVIGTILAIGGAITMVGVPIGKFIKYLAVDPELNRSRRQAVGWTLGTVTALVVLLFAIPVPERHVAEGVVEPRTVRTVYVRSPGFVQSTDKPNHLVEPDGRALLEAKNEALEAERDQLHSQIELYQALALQAEKKLVQGADREASRQVQEYRRNIAEKQVQLENVESKLSYLKIQPPVRGTWFAPQFVGISGLYLQPGDQAGMVVDDQDVMIRVVTKQHLGPRISQQIGEGGQVDIRLRGNPDTESTGTIETIYRFGSRELPSRALGYDMGGHVEVKPDEQGNVRAAENLFEVIIDPQQVSDSNTNVATLRPGQVVMVRFHLPPRPLGLQWWDWLLRLFQATG